MKWVDYRCFIYWVTLIFLLSSTGFTPLILAATAGHVGVVEVLLDKGGDIEAQSERTKDTPLSLACSGGRQEVNTLPFSFTFTILTFLLMIFIVWLCCLIITCVGQVVELLLLRGANKEHRNVSDYTPLSLAASGGYVNIIKILLNAGAEINSRWALGSITLAPWKEWNITSNVRFSILLIWPWHLLVPESEWSHTMETPEGARNLHEVF